MGIDNRLMTIRAVAAPESHNGPAPADEREYSEARINESLICAVLLRVNVYATHPLHQPLRQEPAATPSSWGTSS